MTELQHTALLSCLKGIPYENVLKINLNHTAELYLLSYASD
jgi:hypothetical protein